MRPTKQIKKHIYVFLLLLVSASLVYLPGCGDTSSSGGCSSGTAPDGSTITGPSTLGGPNINGVSCYPTLGFTVKDSSGAPLNNICVEIFSDASIALHSGQPNCSNVIANPQSTIITRTDDYGVVSIELMSGPTPTGGTHFVQVVSGSISAIATTAGAQ